MPSSKYQLCCLRWLLRRLLEPCVVVGVGDRLAIVCTAERRRDSCHSGRPLVEKGKPFKTSTQGDRSVHTCDVDAADNIPHPTFQGSAVVPFGVASALHDSADYHDAARDAEGHVHGEQEGVHPRFGLNEPRDRHADTHAGSPVECDGDGSDDSRSNGLCYHSPSS